MSKHDKVRGLLHRYMAMVLVCLFLVADTMEAQNFSHFAIENKLKSTSTLAPTSQLSNSEWMKKFAIANLALSVEGVRHFIDEQFRHEIDEVFDGNLRKWKEHRAEIIEDIYQPEFRGSITTRAEWIKSAVFIRIAGLLASTGQSAWVDLFGETEANKEFPDLPVIYIDSMLSNTPDNSVQKHEIDELIQWELFRVDELGISTPEEMGEWIRGHIKSPDDKLSGTACEGLNAIQIAELFHHRAYPLSSLNRKILGTTIFDDGYINRMLQLYPVSYTKGVNVGAHGNNEEKGDGLMPGNWIEANGAYFMPMDLASELTDTLKDLFRQARSSIYMDFFLINDESLWSILEEKARQGVDVKIIIGKNPRTMRKASQSLIEGVLAKNIPNMEIVRYIPDVLRDGFRVTEPFPDDHRKLAIVDGKYAFVGDCNLKYWQERVSSILLYSPRGVGDFTRIFSQCWSLLRGKGEVAIPGEMPDKPYTILTERSLRENIRLNILRQILKAERRIYIAQWCMDDGLVIKALASKKVSCPDIDIRVILNRSEGLLTARPITVRYARNARSYDRLRAEGISVRWFASAQAKNYDHRKLVICDDTVITGSSDMYAKAYDGNRELSIKISVPRLTQHCVDVFEKDWMDGYEESYAAKEWLKSSAAYFFRHAWKGLYKEWVIVKYKLFNILPNSLFLSGQSLIRKIKMFAGIQYEDMSADIFYRGFSGDEYRLMVDYGIFRITMGPDGYTNGKGIFTTDSHDIAVRSARIKKSRKRQSYVAVLRPKPGVRLLKLTAPEREKFKIWSLERFGIKGGSFLISVYLMERGYDGYYWREYDKGHTVVFFDPSSFEVLKFERMKDASLGTEKIRQPSAEERNFARLIKRYLEESSMPDRGRSRLMALTDIKPGGVVRPDVEERKIISKLHALSDAPNILSACERKKLLCLLPEIIQLMRKYSGTTIEDMSASTIEKFFSADLKEAILNLLKSSPFSEKMLYDESAIYKNEKNVLEQYVSNGLNSGHEMWVIPLLYLATIDKDTRLYSGMRLLYKRAVNNPWSVVSRPKSITSILGQKAGFAHEDKNMIAALVDDMDLMQVRSGRSMWRDFGGFSNAKRNILIATTLYPSEIEAAFNHALRVAALAKLTIEIFMRDAGERILTWEEVGDFIVAASCHDIGKGAKESFIKVTRSELIKGVDIAVKDAFIKVSLNSDDMKVSFPDGEKAFISLDGVNVLSWTTKRVGLNGASVDIKIMTDDSGNYLFRTPISMIDLINAPRQLTRDEQRLVTLVHPVESVRMLEESGLKIPEAVRLAVLYHHNLKGIDLIADRTLRERVRKIANLLSLFDILDASQDYSRPYKIGLLSEDIVALCRSLSGFIDKTCSEWFARFLAQDSVYRPDILGVFARTKPFRILYHASGFSHLLRPFAIDPFREILLRLRLREGEFEVTFNRITEIIEDILIDPDKAADTTKKVMNDRGFQNASRRLLSDDNGISLVIVAINSIIEQSDMIFTPVSLSEYLLSLDTDSSIKIFSCLKSEPMKAGILKHLSAIGTKHSLWMRERLLNNFISERAYSLWLEGGRQAGKDVDYWLKAESNIKNKDEADDGSMPVFAPSTGSPEDADCMIIAMYNAMRCGKMGISEARNKILGEILPHWAYSDETMINDGTLIDILSRVPGTPLIKDILACLTRHRATNDQSVMREELKMLLAKHDKHIITSWIAKRTGEPDNFIEINPSGIKDFIDFTIRASVLSLLDSTVKDKLSSKIMRLLQDRKIVLLKVKDDEKWPSVYKDGVSVKVRSYITSGEIYIFVEEKAGLLANGFEYFRQWLNDDMVVQVDGTISDGKFAALDAGVVTAKFINPGLFYQLGKIGGLADEIMHNSEIVNFAGAFYSAAEELDHQDGRQAERDRALDKFVKCMLSMRIKDSAKIAPNLPAPLKENAFTNVLNGGTAADIGNFVTILDRISREEKQGNSERAGPGTVGLKYYTIRYNSRIIRRDSPAERLLMMYVNEKLLLFMHGEDRVKLISNGNDEGLISVECFKDRSRQEKIGECRVNIEEDVRDKAVRIIGMLNMAFLASQIPAGIPEEGRADYYAQIAAVKKQFKDICKSDPTPDTIQFTSQGVCIRLPHAIPVSVEKADEYYHLVIVQLGEAA